MTSGSGWNLWVWLAGGGCGWNLWVWLVGVVVRRYIDFLILLIPIYSSCIYLFFFAAASLLFVHLKVFCSFLRSSKNLTTTANTSLSLVVPSKTTEMNLPCTSSLTCLHSSSKIIGTKSIMCLGSVRLYTFSSNRLLNSSDSNLAIGFPLFIKAMITCALYALLCWQWFSLAMYPSIMSLECRSNVPFCSLFILSSFLASFMFL